MITADDLAQRFPLTCSNIYCGAYIPEGWEKLVLELLAKLEGIALAGQEVAVAQIKEKFGGLRCYCDNASPEIEAAIREAEEVAWVTCETCGKSGTCKSFGGWLRTVCEEHER